MNEQVLVEPRTSALNMTLPARCCAAAQAANIDRYLPTASGLQQTSRTSLLLSIDGTDGQTDTDRSGHRQ